LIDYYGMKVYNYWSTVLEVIKEKHHNKLGNSVMLLQDNMPAHT